MTQIVTPPQTRPAPRLAARYTRTAIVLHWIIAALITISVVLGLTADTLPGRRLDEGIAMMRAVWSEDPVTFKSRYIPSVIEGMTMTPMPVSPIPLWFGGKAEPTLKRTIRIGDGWHGSGLTPDEAAPIVKRLREARPGADFTISMRVQWDGTDRGVLRSLVDNYAAIGVEHLLVAPHDRNVDDWEKVTEGVGALVA
ncbi:MAG: LLM class flavin-dependent oxidoreductase [Rhodopila sp.]|jgi:hypothetical protein